MKNIKKITLFLGMMVVIYVSLQAWYDEKLFTTTIGGAGKYNVVMVQDHTGSMCAVIYHPDFRPNDSVLNNYESVSLPRSSTYQGIGQTSWYLRWVNGNYIRSASGRVKITSYNSGTNVLRVNNKTTYIREGNWILQSRDGDTNIGDDDIEYNINYQMVAKVTAVDPGSSYTDLTLDPSTIKGTPTVNYYIDIYSSNSSSYTTKIVKLYGSTLDQGDYDVAYAMDSPKYLEWIFGRANDRQRQQVTDYSTLAYDIEYNGYLRATPVSPTNAYALNPDNSNSATTLLAEWNAVMKDIYPSKISNLNDDLTTATVTFDYNNAKDSLEGYGAGFYIKIDAETMKVTGHVPDPDNAGSGQFTVTRAQNGTTAAAHNTGSAIMIYDNADAMAGPLISEYVPATHLFSSTQHVTESTGDVNPAWTQVNKNVNGTNKTCYRYKRVFTRIQTAREAVCDLITAKNVLSSVASLAAAAVDSDTTLYYYNVFNADFVNMVAPFFIKVVDADGAGNPEVMLVTTHDSSTNSLIVSRGQQGTSPRNHGADSKILIFAGARDLVRFGIFVFPENDPQGGTTSELLRDASDNFVGGLNDFGQKNTDGTYKTASYVNTILDSVDRITASGGTPLAKALAQVWNYLKPNNNTFTINPYSSYIRRTGASDWKAVDNTTFGTAEKFDDASLFADGNPHPKGSPMEYWCQKNYAVLITDGVATSDSDFNELRYGVFYQAINKTAIAGNVVTDFFKFNYNRSSGPTPWGDITNDNEATNDQFLPDLAYFLSHQDMFPTVMIKTGTWDTTNKIFTSGTPQADTTLYNESDSDPYKQWPGNQNINTYTVGLCVANTVLAKAAKNGGGVNFTASNYKDLSDAFQRIITSVSLLSEPMTYTTYAAPKQSITGGKYGYVAHFIPQEKAMWEGHLRRFRLDDDGDFPLNIDDLDKDNPGEVTVKDEDGNPMTVPSFQWDVADKLAVRATDRVVYTAKKVSGSWTRVNFMGGDIDYTDLDVISTQTALVKKFVQNFLHADGTPIAEYVIHNDTNSPPRLYKCGETFHFNPQLVGYPLKWKASFDPSYASFYFYYSGEDDGDPDTPSDPRKEVVYTGANDGKLHCFQASDGAELWGYVPNSLLKKLKDPALNPLIATQHTYFVDGKAVVKDIRASTANNNYLDWKTGLFFGMGIGGRSYCALDVTDPDDPQVLWEFDDGYSATNANGRMGFTEAKPIVVDMNAGAYGNFPAAILAGGYNETEVALDSTLPLQDWQKKEGKSMYILDARDGTVVKQLLPGSGANTTDITYLSALKHAITAAPAAFDSNNDGIADYLYFAESGDPDTADNQGGRIWKMNCFGNPLNWTAQVIYQAPAGQTIFISPTLGYDENYRVWVMFGTGRRPQAAFGSGGVFTNNSGQFVAFIDDGSGTTLTNADLDNITSAIQTTGDDTFDLVDSDNTVVSHGLFFDFFMDSNEIMFEPSPLYVAHQVYFMTFSPHLGSGSSGSSDDPCGSTSSVGGMHYVYQFKLTSKGSQYTLGDFLAQSGKILGYGPMDDKWKPYLGSGEAGNFVPNPTLPVDLSNIFGPLMWKEEKK